MACALAVYRCRYFPDRTSSFVSRTRARRIYNYTSKVNRARVHRARICTYIFGGESRLPEGDILLRAAGGDEWTARAPRD